MDIWTLRQCPLINSSHLQSCNLVQNNHLVQCYLLSTDFMQSNSCTFCVKTFFQVRVIESLEPSPTENALTYGNLVGYFSERRERSYERCPSKFVTFDFPATFPRFPAIDFGQVFVILKRTAEQTELPEIKIYGNRNEGNFFNSLS